ncbi:MAG: DUF3892 domain-containing protein [Rhodospirillaceae bacterium]
MADRRVTASGKDTDGDITKLCNSSAEWSPRYKSGAIKDIEEGYHTYYTQDKNGKRSDIKVVNGQSGKYLRSDPNGESTDNLDNLPNC